MSDKIEFTGKVNELGDLHIVNRQYFDEAVARFAGKEVEVIVQKKRVVRSSPQNRWYWKNVIEPMQEGFHTIGYDFSKEQTHEFVKMNFNYKEVVNESSGEIMRLPMSTTRLTKGEFALMVEKIAIFSAEFLGIVIGKKEMA